MPFKLSVGLSKKIGLPNYGSLGASCQIECELDGSVLAAGAEEFQHQAEQLYAASAQAVESELARYQRSTVASRARARFGFLPSHAKTRGIGQGHR